MHRSRLSVLVILAAVAACSSREDPQATELLSQDSTLVARLAMDRAPRELPLPVPLPDACGAITVAAQPTVANGAEAEALTRRAYEAETLGNLPEARSLLRRASELDGTNKSTAYHLGRASEALGDRAAAVTAYCRYLALTPTTAESEEARQRVSRLSHSESRVAAGSVDDRAPTLRRAAATKVASARRVTRERPTVAPRVVASAAVEQSAPATSPERDTHPAIVAAGAADDSASPRDSATTLPDVADAAESPAASGDVVTTPRPTPGADQPSTASRTERRGASRAQAAGIGAAAGAIIGAATGRSVKGAVIGAAAGGILGAVVGGGTLPIGRGIRP